MKRTLSYLVSVWGFLVKNLSAGLVLRPLWCYSHKKYSPLGVHVNGSLSIIFHGYWKETLIILRSVLCCAPKPVWSSGQRRFCVCEWVIYALLVSVVHRTWACYKMNSDFRKLPTLSANLLVLLQRYEQPIFHVFRNILMLDFDILLPHGRITINFPLHTDRLEDC